jgi:hypothetical protein
MSPGTMPAMRIPATEMPARLPSSTPIELGGIMIASAPAPMIGPMLIDLL